MQLSFFFVVTSILAFIWSHNGITRVSKNNFHATIFFLSRQAPSLSFGLITELHVTPKTTFMQLSFFLSRQAPSLSFGLITELHVSPKTTFPLPRQDIFQLASLITTRQLQCPGITLQQQQQQQQPPSLFVPSKLG
jgi:hypothetical protein